MCVSSFKVIGHNNDKPRVKTVSKCDPKRIQRSAQLDGTEHHMISYLDSNKATIREVSHSHQYEPRDTSGRKRSS